MKSTDSLIVYFSRRGNNYVGGAIVNLAVGNTEVIAKKIKELTGSSTFKIETVKTYPDDYTETTEVAKAEKKKNARPELTAAVADMNSYDVIYLGYPNWWGTMPMAVFSFLEAHDFSAKTIVPFCTHEGSGMGVSERDLKRLCPNSRVLTGLAIVGGTVEKADRPVRDWLEALHLLPPSA
jgi:flavodoxin